ncbi:M23 family metallopeptidase [Aequorivita xiaoshiensis]|uniref:M23 family metallopeptidase n=1 Tax=Aequorivita xiaoshiensis TaxID=2874476 RepID=A0A9X1QYG7_9FLAO|nr:M23 family metallopeptidase [Aequorivita xiaoshiensis]MCG2429905.1 M23 family metallopeptidase [Aequorivita xiaoshiensis]
MSLLLGGCKEDVQKTVEISEKPLKLPARVAYEKEFNENDSTFMLWKEAFQKAKHDNLQITLPYSESGVYSEDELNVYSYNIQLKEGERIVVDLQKQVDSSLVFIDFFEVKKDSLRLLKSAEEYKSMFSKEIEESGLYKLILHPQLNMKGSFQLKIYSEPLYPFPVVGGVNKDIQGFWADPRDTGSRSHEGVDIFAKRGTPVIAITDGTISSTGNGGFGGLQVWITDKLKKKRIYYAHLDSFIVSEGDKVKIGDTIGFVGNTGNATELPPHLHFGVYKEHGAVNPISFIKKTEIQTIDKPSTVNLAIINTYIAEVRKGPASIFPQLGVLRKNDTISVLGKSQDWFHIHSSKGLKGYVSERVITPLSSN